MESAALSAFAMLVVTQLDPGTALLLVPGIYTLTAFINMACSGCMKCTKCKGNGYTAIEEQDNEPQGTPSSTKKTWRTIRLLLDHSLTCAFGFAMQILGLLAFTIYLCTKENAYMTGITALACGVSLSIVWSSWIQQKIFAAPKDHTNPSSNATYRAIPHPGSPQYPASRKAGRETCVCVCVCMCVCALCVCMCMCVYACGCVYIHVDVRLDQGVLYILCMYALYLYFFSCDNSSPFYIAVSD